MNSTTADGVNKNCTRDAQPGNPIPKTYLRGRFNSERRLGLLEAWGDLRNAKEAYDAGRMTKDELLARLEAVRAKADYWSEQDEWKAVAEVEIKPGWASSKEIAWLVWQKTDGKCTYCNVKINPFDRKAPDGFQIDHVVPRSHGGSDEPDNLAPACRACNNSKARRTPENWRASHD